MKDFKVYDLCLLYAQAKHGNEWCSTNYTHICCSNHRCIIILLFCIIGSGYLPSVVIIVVQLYCQNTKGMDYNQVARSSQNKYTTHFHLYFSKSSSSTLLYFLFPLIALLIHLYPPQNKHKEIGTPRMTIAPNILRNG